MVYRFADCELDEQLYQLRRDGAPVAVEPKVFDVLAYLVQHRDHVVSKDELLDKLWPGQVVGENALTRCIRAARSAVGDDGVKQEVIETQHGRGYRFVAAVAAPVLSAESRVPSQEEGASSQSSVGSSQEEVVSIQQENGENTGQAEGLRLEAAGPPPSSPSSLQPLASSLSQDSALSTQDLSSPTPVRAWSIRPLLLMGLLLLVGISAVVQYLSLPTPNPQPLTPSLQPLPLPDKPSIVVLPFTNLSGDPAQQYFSDGITEELITTLARFPSLYVIARHSAFTYKGKEVKVQDVGKEMGVRYVLEGSVQRAEQRVRINAQLVDTVTGDHLWVERYDRPFSDIFTLQDEIVQKIVTTLKLQLTLREQGHLVRKRTDSMEAYDYYLRGIEYYYRLTRDAHVQARQMFEKAIELDPHYAEAYAVLSGIYRLAWALRWSQDPQTLERALALAQRAIALDDTLASGHGFLSLVYVQKQQYDQAIAEGERAIAFAPNNAGPYATQAEVLNLAGRPEEALRMVEQAMRLNPRYPAWYLIESGWAYRSMGRYEEAITALKTVLLRNPDFISAYLFLSYSYHEQWIFQQSLDPQLLHQALAAAQRAIALSNASPHAHIALGYAYLFQKQYEQAIAEMERAMALVPTEAVSYTALAEVLSDMGRTEDALEAAAQALRLKSEVVDGHLAGVGRAYAVAGRYEEALAPLQRYLSRYPHNLPAHLTLAVVYSELDREAEAQAEAAEVLRLNPHFSLEVHRQRDPIKDPAMLERHLAALRKAGLK